MVHLIMTRVSGFLKKKDDNMMIVTRQGGGEGKRSADLLPTVKDNLFWWLKLTMITTEIFIVLLWSMN